MLRIRPREHHNASNGAHTSIRPKTDVGVRYGSARRFVGQTTDTFRSICQTTDPFVCLCPVMTDFAGKIPLVPLQPGFCGLRVNHIFHHYLAAESGVVYACPGAARPGRLTQHIREPGSERRYRPAAPDAP